MLKPAKRYFIDLLNRLEDTYDNDKYKYYHSGGYHPEIDIPKDDWNDRRFVSICPETNEVIGFMGYSISRTTNSVYNLGIINFSPEHKIIFARDLKQFLWDIFFKYNHNKLQWSVVIGNPIEASYDRMCLTYNGRIVGYYEDEVKLYNGEICNSKLYEITKKNLLKSNIIKSIINKNSKGDKQYGIWK